jgi:methylated-DNA-protein-cysteine methyltransferase-like protein
MLKSTQELPHRASALYDRIYACVCAVPPGCVTSYGAVGRRVGCSARVVGYALHHLRHVARPDVPWQRVINARGMISTYGDEQRRLLEAEGVVFDEHGCVDFAVFGWQQDDTMTRYS